MGGLFGSNGNGLFGQGQGGDALNALALAQAQRRPVADPSSPAFAGPAVPRAPMPPPTAPAAPSADDIQRRTAYAQELGIQLPGPHKFNWGKAALIFFGGAPVAQALLNGDYEAAGRLNARGQMVAARTKVAEADRLHQLSVYSALRDSGATKNDAIIAMTNLEELGRNFNTRFRTDDVPEGHVRYRPNIDGTASTFTTPKLVQHGPDYAFVAPPGSGGINSTAGPPPLDGNGADTPPGMPSIPMLPSAPSQAVPLGRSGRQISLPGADDGEADAFVRQGVNAGASGNDIFNGLKDRFGFTDQALAGIAQPLATALAWKQRNPNRPYDGPVTVGDPSGQPLGAPAALPPGPRGRPPMLPAGPQSAPFLRAPPANVVSAGSLRTDAERYADTLFPRGSEQWRAAVQDAELKANGPTAYGQNRTLQGERLGVEMRGQDFGRDNNIRTTATSRDNSIRATDASMRNRDRTPAARVLNTRGEETLIYPDNRVVTLRDSMRPSGHNSHGGSRPSGRPAPGGGLPPVGAKGAIIRNRSSGETFVSNGSQWVKK